MGPDPMRWYNNLNSSENSPASMASFISFLNDFISTSSTPNAMANVVTTVMIRIIWRSHRCTNLRSPVQHNPKHTLFFFRMGRSSINIDQKKRKSPTFQMIQTMQLKFLLKPGCSLDVKPLGEGQFALFHGRDHFQGNFPICHLLHYLFFFRLCRHIPF